jgi:hypothetical protein
VSANRWIISVFSPADIDKLKAATRNNRAAE